MWHGVVLAQYLENSGEVMNNEHMFDIAKGCALEARKMGDLKKLISLSKIQLSTLQSLVKTSSL